MDTRQTELQHWAQDQLRQSGLTLAPASADASFRRYFRVRRADGASFILMDAPPAAEDVRPFVRIAAALRQAGVLVPEVLAQDPERGFLLLTDLGDTTYLDSLTPDNVERLYGDALGALNSIQICGPGESELPAYDRDRLLAEMAFFPDWLLARYLALDVDALHGPLQVLFEKLADAALEQPRVCVHRDYHSRNLMLTGQHNPGILDFQDAVFGPITYDLVSLLRDCYIRWPRPQVEEWALGFRELAIQSGTLRPDQTDERTFLRWFDWMGVQRHLKAAGIFARLMVRDQKPGYLRDIPRTLGYIVEVAGDYAELSLLAELIEQQVLPAMTRQLEQSA